MKFFGKKIIKKVAGQYAVNDVKSIHFKGYASGGCIETCYFTKLSAALAFALASAGSFVHLNKERVDFVNDYGMTEAQVNKLLSIPYDEFTKLFEYATDLNDINRHYRITTAFRSRRKFKPVEELKKYIKKEDLAKFEYLRENSGLIKYR